ncbi:putative FAD-linked oxidoreductase [Aureliella helgolandensis]|uniref:Putative FAD-linked oxidoreductase n=2 Tax=Aureliella helgolandensis TaxID=2527968 RepID=A0A518G8R2_9BACT|nr:putative FAD-linked oxidoreductase [Aureliella helgolandensis]
MDNLLTDLRQQFPADRIQESASAKAAFQSDGLTAFAVQPRAIIVPRTSDEVVQAVQWCNKHSVPFVARGSGTSLSGGSLPHAEGIVIALNRLNRILSVDLPNRLAVVEPGVINSKLTTAVEHAGLYYAPDPSSQHVCTIGGNVAFNSGGAHCLKYGMTSNHVMAMKMVLGDGEVLQVGPRMGEPLGPDLLGLMVGSEGLLGIALEITVKLMPKPESFHTVLAGYRSLQDAGAAVATIISSGLLPAAMEIMDHLSMQAATAGVGATYPAGVAAVLIVELDGSQEAVAEERILLDRLLAETGATEVIVAANAEERASIWKGRKSVFSAVGRLTPDFIVQDGVVPRSKLGYALQRIEELSQAAGIPVANVFHAGDGNLHPLIMFDGRKAGELHRSEELAAQIVQLCIDLGGSITGEHGVGMEKRQFLAGMFDEASIECMRRVRLACDPLEISNRGKMFPDAEAPSLGMYGLHPLEAAGIASRM